MKFKPANSAFTLIETLIVIAIGLLILGVGTLYITGANTAKRAEAEGTRIAALLQAAQERSMSQESNARWGVFVRNDAGAGASYELYQVDEDLLIAGGSTPPGTTLEKRKLAAELTFSSPALGEEVNVIFARATGLPVASTTLTVVGVDNASFTAVISVHRNGKIERE
jgi:prepilin-type N-terminal cleavage/methylation domain-containing protein